MTNWPELYILRHGQTTWNAEHRIQGSLDSPLTDAGRAHARAQQEILQSRSLDGFTAFSSPQGRARKTAEIALDGILSPIRRDARLAEIRVGAWEGKRRVELDLPHASDEGYAEGLMLYELAPGGEGFAALRLRCESFLRELTRPAVLVTHGMTSRMLRLILQNMDNSEIGDLEGGQGVIYHLKAGVSRKLG